MQNDSEHASIRQITRNEKLKEAHPTLAGGIGATLADPAAESFSADDCDLLKFHGIHQGTDRDRRGAAKEFRFQVVARMPGGVVSAADYLEFDRFATEFGNHTLRITSRQSLHIQGVPKTGLGPLMKRIQGIAATTLATGGDVARNVMAPPTGFLAEAAQADARRVSDALLPLTPAYGQIWGSDNLPRTNGASLEFTDPLYGRTYLPRKFKIAFAIPPLNDVDVFSNCLGFVAIAEGDNLCGYDLLAGGGLGTSFGNPATCARLADVVGFIPREQTVATARAAVTIHRDFGDRANRSHARLKYLLQEKGVDWFRHELEERLGFKIQAPRPFRFTTQEDRLGWREEGDGHFSLGLWVENGRIQDLGERRLRTALRMVAATVKCDIRLTPSQNMLLSHIPASERSLVTRIFEENGVDPGHQADGIRWTAMGCPALPLCGRALAEAERFLPKLLDQIGQLLAQMGLADEKIILRMTGCPNGCDRPRTAEIGVIGKAPNKYRLYLGGNRAGTRLNELFKENVRAEDLAEELRPVFARFALERKQSEPFGDFCRRVVLPRPSTESPGPAAPEKR